MVTNIAPENGWLEYSFPFGSWPIFRCELLVLGRVVDGLFHLLINWGILGLSPTDPNL